LWGRSFSESGGTPYNFAVMWHESRVRRWLLGWYAAGLSGCCCFSSLGL